VGRLWANFRIEILQVVAHTYTLIHTPAARTGLGPQQAVTSVVARATTHLSYPSSPTYLS